MKSNFYPLIALCLTLSACSVPKNPTPSPYTEAEQVLLNSFKADYDNGEYRPLIKRIKATLELKNGSAAFREEALKYQAFSECISNNPRSCRATFRTLFSENPNFALSVAEENHPAWKASYTAERNRAARLVKPTRSVKPKATKK